MTIKQQEFRKTGIIILTLFMFTSCIFESFPRRLIKVVNFDYSDTQIKYKFPTSKKDFLEYCNRCSFSYKSVDGTTFSTFLFIKDPYISASTKLILKEDSGILNLRLKAIDTIVYCPESSFGTEILKNLNKRSCQIFFQKSYIIRLSESIRECLKADSLYMTGLNLIEDKEFEKAYLNFQTIAETISSDNDDFNFVRYSTLNRMAFIKIQLGQYEKAIEIMDKAMAIEPYWLNIETRNDQIRRNGKLPYWVNGKYIDELKSQYKYNAINTAQLLIHANYAIAYKKIGKIDEARRMLKNADELYPFEPFENKALFIN